MRARLPWLLALGYAVVFTALGSLRYAVHRNFVDFGIFTQTAASAFGCFCNPIEGSHWAFHFSPVLYLAGAALFVWHSPVTLIALQSIACALVIPPVYAMIARRSSTGVAAFGAVVAALYPPLAGLAFGDFHENGFAPAAIAWAAWAFDSGYLRPAFAFALVAICVKEDQAIFVAIAGIAVWWRFRRTMAGRYAFAAALIGFAFAWEFFHVIQPHHVAAPHWAPERFYDWTSGDLRELLRAGLFQRIAFLVLIFAPLAFVPFRSRTIWFAVPPLAEVLLSRMSTTFTLGTHYAGAWMGYVFVAFAFGIRKLPEHVARRTLWFAFAFCVIELAVANPMHPGLNLRAIQARDRVLDAMLDAVPPGASIATQEEAYTHLALRDPNATLLPESPGVPLDACFVLIDDDFPDSPRLQEYGAAFNALARRGTYVIVRREGNAALYRRTTACR
jgi:uncharacterized membrane protein